MNLCPRGIMNLALKIASKFEINYEAITLYRCGTKYTRMFFFEALVEAQGQTDAL